MTVLLWFGVCAVGGGGAVLRFLVDGSIVSRLRTVLPVGTLVVNLSGSVALGLLAGMGLGESAELLAATAAVGSYTTFSTWMLETQRLVEDRQVRWAVVNVLLSLACGLGAAAVGRWIL